MRLDTFPRANMYIYGTKVEKSPDDPHTYTVTVRLKRSRTSTLKYNVKVQCSLENVPKCDKKQTYVVNIKLALDHFVKQSENE